MKTRPLPTVFALAAAPFLALSLVSCSSSGSSGDGAGSATKTASAQDWALAHAKCLRDAGHDAQDPSVDGDGQGFSLGDGDSVEKFTADSKKCDAQVTEKLGERPVSDEQKQQQQEDAKADDCLRKEGIDAGGGKALNYDDIPADVQEKCGVQAPSDGFGRAQ